MLHRCRNIAIVSPGDVRAGISNIAPPRANTRGEGANISTARTGIFKRRRRRRRRSESETTDNPARIPGDKDDEAGGSSASRRALSAAAARRRRDFFHGKPPSRGPTNISPGRLDISPPLTSRKKK